MAIFDLSDLVTSLTWEQIRASAYTTLDALGFSTTSWRPGGVSRTIVALLSRILAPWTVIIVDANKAGFLDFATGSGLKICAAQFYNVVAEPASFASGFVTLNNAGGGVYSFAAYEVTFENSTTDKTYYNTEAFTLAALETGKVIAIEAVEVGSGSTAAPGQVDKLGTTLLGVTCTNAAALVGTDEESEDSIRTRCKLKLAALSPDGPPAVYDYVARTSELGGVHITRTQVLADHDAGEVTVYVADEDGAISAPNVALVQAGIDRWAVPICTEALVASASAISVPVTITVYASTRSGLDDASVEARALEGLTAYFEAVPVGGVIISPDDGKLFKVSVLEALGRIFPEALKVDMAAPAADVAIGDGSVAVLGAVTVTLVQVAT
jgi:phage-related baseplate assembly protein